ncbi:MAG: hypothetical protein ACO1N0_03535 [Fluviicola sp.]
MKKQLFLFLSISVLLVPACKKKEKDPKSNETPTTVNSFRLKHNGVLYSTNAPNVSVNNMMVGITAGVVSETGNYYQLAVNRDLLPGTYEYTGSGDDAMVFFILSDQLTFSENEGSITVLSNDTILKKIVFNFEFEMLESNSHSDTILITEGNAKISY